VVWLLRRLVQSLSRLCFGPAFWLTDYLIAANLQAAYAAQAEGGGGRNRRATEEQWIRGPMAGARRRLRWH
jgi:hypothetical protein